MQLGAECDIKDEAMAQRGEAPSRAQQEHRKAEDNRPQQEVCDSTLQERTSFDLVKIHLMLHSEESVQGFGHLVKHSTEMREMNNPKMCKGPCRRSNPKFRFKGQILNNYSRIHDFRMRCLHLRQLAKEGHSSPEIQEALQLYRPKDQIVVIKCNREQVPIPANLPLSFR